MGVETIYRMVLGTTQVRIRAITSFHEDSTEKLIRGQREGIERCMFAVDNIDLSIPLLLLPKRTLHSSVDIIMHP